MVYYNNRYTINLHRNHDCFYCNRVGHIARYCIKRLIDNRNKSFIQYIWRNNKYNINGNRHNNNNNNKNNINIISSNINNSNNNSSSSSNSTNKSNSSNNSNSSKSSSDSSDSTNYEIISPALVRSKISNIDHVKVNGSNNNKSSSSSNSSTDSSRTNYEKISPALVRSGISSIDHINVNSSSNNNSSNKSAPVASFSSSHKAPSMSILSFNDRKIRTVIGTGLSISLVNEKVVGQMNLEIKPTSVQADVNGEKLNIIGEVIVIFNCGVVKKSIKMYVVIGMVYSCVLGTQVFKDLNIQYNWKENYIFNSNINFAETLERNYCFEEDKPKVHNQVVSTRSNEEKSSMVHNVNIVEIKESDESYNNSNSRNGINGNSSIINNSDSKQVLNEKKLMKSDNPVRVSRQFKYKIKFKEYFNFIKLWNLYISKRIRERI